jgi:hypothetical protein
VRCSTFRESRNPEGFLQHRMGRMGGCREWVRGARWRTRGGAGELHAPHGMHGGDEQVLQPRQVVGPR